MKKHSNLPVKSEQRSKQTKSRIPMQRDTKELMAELLGKLTEKQDPKAISASARKEQKQGRLRPNLDRLTVGVDLGDKWSAYCILGLEGETLIEGQLQTAPLGVAEFFQSLPAARVVLEVGTHSAWVRELISGCGHEVLVANPRLMEGPKRRRRKNDRIDANKLARLGRMDPESLYPIQHRSPEVRQDLVMLRARDALVAVRTELINSTRGLVKSVGARLPKCASPSFSKKVKESLPVEIREALLPLVQLVAALSDSIQGYDEKIEKLGSEKYGHAALLRQVKGVGPITALISLCIDLGEPEPIRQESRCGALSGISTQSGRLWRHPATIRNQQSRRYNAAPATGRERAVHFGALRTGHRLTTVWATVMRAGRKECQKESGGSRGPETGGLTAPSLGEWRGV